VFIDTNCKVKSIVWYQSEALLVILEMRRDPTSNPQNHAHNEQIFRA
jgi:hypothetical protein